MNINSVKPRPSKLAKLIFEEACTVENMDAKFGKSLSREERAVKNFILSQSPVLGRIPFIDEIVESFGHLKLGKVLKILNNLNQFDVIHLNSDQTSIVAAYPFSGTETSHRVTLNREGSKNIFAMCAIDALGIGFMFNCDVLIESLCSHCRENISVEIHNNEIVSLKPGNIVVWCDREYSCCAATSLCKNTNFFSSKKHFEEWQNFHFMGRGNLLDIGEAFYLGKLFFKNRLKKK